MFRVLPGLFVRRLCLQPPLLLSSALAFSQHAVPRASALLYSGPQLLRGFPAALGPRLASGKVPSSLINYDSGHGLGSGLWKCQGRGQLPLGNWTSVPSLPL